MAGLISASIVTLTLLIILQVVPAHSIATAFRLVDLEGIDGTKIPKSETCHALSGLQFLSLGCDSNKLLIYDLHELLSLPITASSSEAIGYASYSPSNNSSVTWDANDNIIIGATPERDFITDFSSGTAKQYEREDTDYRFGS